MRTHRRDRRGFRGFVAPGAVLLLLSAGPLTGAAGLQERAVVSSEVSVSSGETALRLEFVDGGRLEVVFREGEILLDGDRVGSYVRGDALDQSWRSLLGRAVALDNGPLAQALREWTPPSGLSADVVEGATRLDEVLEERLLPPVDTGGRAVPADPGVVEGLLSRPELLPSLGRALEGIDRSGARIQVGGDPLDISAGETVEGPLVVVDADVEVRGIVEGDLVLVRGALRVREGGEIRGDVRLVDARLFRDGGQITGEVLNVEAPSSPGVDVDRLREQIRDELRRELRAESSRSARDRGVPGAVRNLTRGVGGLIENLMTVLILSGLGWVVVHFAGDRLRTVAEAIQTNPTRSGAVGLAGAFLILPVWVLGMLALVISLVGILALPFWILLFPLVVAGALFLGGFAVASLLGEWLSRRDIQGLERLRPSNPFHTVPAGIALLFLAFMTANVLQIAGPLTGIFRGLLVVAGVLGLLLAVAVGLGGVLLTRGGAQPTGGRGGWGADPDLDGWDPFGGSERASRWQARWDAERARWRREPAPDLEADPDEKPRAGTGEPEPTRPGDGEDAPQS
jgi:hypothetical protein